MRKLIAAFLVFLVFGAPASLAQDDALTYGLSIQEYLEQALPSQEGRQINYDDFTGVLTVIDTPSNQRLIKELIRQFDVGPQQVMIEARFVEIEFTDLNELGIEWYWYRPDRGNSGPEFGVSTSGTNYQGIQWDGGTTTATTFPLTSTYGMDFFISQAFANSGFIRAYLHALASEGRANLLSSPRVTTLSGQMANIQVTQTIPYASEISLENEGTADHPNWTVSYTIDERLTGITLEVTPYVSENTDVITLDIHPEISTLYDRVDTDINQISTEDTPDAPNLLTISGLSENLGWPIVDTRTMQTSVMVRSGRTVIMGGFVKDDDTDTKKKIPFLGDIPVIGPLFRYNYQTRTKRNLVIFLTATLITAEGEPVANLQ